MLKKLGAGFVLVVKTLWVILRDNIDVKKLIEDVKTIWTK